MHTRTSGRVSPLLYEPEIERLARRNRAHSSQPQSSTPASTYYSSTTTPHSESSEMDSMPSHGVNLPPLDPPNNTTNGNRPPPNEEHNRRQWEHQQAPNIDELRNNIRDDERYSVPGYESMDNLSMRNNDDYNTQDGSSREDEEVYRGGDDQWDENDYQGGQYGPRNEDRGRGYGDFEGYINNPPPPPPFHYVNRPNQGYNPQQRVPDYVGRVNNDPPRRQPHYPEVNGPIRNQPPPQHQQP